MLLVQWTENEDFLRHFWHFSSFNQKKLLKLKTSKHKTLLDFSSRNVCKSSFDYIVDKYRSIGEDESLIKFVKELDLFQLISKPFDESFKNILNFVKLSAPVNEDFGIKEKLRKRYDGNKSLLMMLIEHGSVGNFISFWDFISYYFDDMKSQQEILMEKNDQNLSIFHYSLLNSCEMFLTVLDWHETYFDNMTMRGLVLSRVMGEELLAYFIRKSKKEHGLTTLKAFLKYLRMLLSDHELKTYLIKGGNFSRLVFFYPLQDALITKGLLESIWSFYEEIFSPRELRSIFNLLPQRLSDLLKKKKKIVGISGEFSNECEFHNNVNHVEN